MSTCRNFCSQNETDLWIQPIHQAGERIILILKRLILWLSQFQANPFPTPAIFQAFDKSFLSFGGAFVIRVLPVGAEFYMVEFTFFQFSKGNFRAYKSYMTKTYQKNIWWLKPWVCPREGARLKLTEPLQLTKFGQGVRQIQDTLCNGI